MTKVTQMPLEWFADNPWQTRPVDPAYAAELARDIAVNGLIQPPTARMGRGDDLKGGEVQLATGHHRIAAIRILAEEDPDQWTTVRVLIGEYSDEQMATVAFAENYRRKNLTAVQEARAIRKAMDDFNWKQREAGERFGLERSTVTHKLRLLELPEQVQEANAGGQLSERQALSLKPIGDLMAKLDGAGDVEWSEKEDPRQIGWGPPQAPEKYIDFVVDHKDSVTSDDIRDYAKKMLGHAGEKLPGDIPRMELDGKTVLQPLCKRCPKRVNSYCMASACLGKKKALYREQIARETAAELELPYSADNKHFKSWEDWKESRILSDAWKAGTCDHLVVGFTNGGYAARPFSDSTHVSKNAGDIYSSRVGVALGCTHEEIGDCAAPVEDGVEIVEDLDPLAERAEQWIKAAATQHKEIEKRAKNALTGELANGIYEAGPLSVLMELLEDSGERDGMGEELGSACKDLVDYAWQKGRYITYDHNSAYSLYPAARKILAIAGIDPFTVLEEGYDDEQIQVRECERLLGWWGERRKLRWSLERHAEQIVEPLGELLARLEDISGPISGELNQIIAELVIVRLEIRDILEAAEQELVESIKSSEEEGSVEDTTVEATEDNLVAV